MALSSGRSPQIGAPGRATRCWQSTRCLGGLQHLVEQGEDRLLSFLFIHVVRHVLELPAVYVQSTRLRTQARPTRYMSTARRVY
jgi:hypothetical protein